MANKTITVSIENNTDVLTALTLAREGHSFHISHINYVGVDPNLLGIDDQLGWEQLGKEAWANSGNINFKSEEATDGK